MDTTVIWNAFHNEIFGFILKRVNDKELAKDILQEVFIKIHLKLHTLSDPVKLAGWVYSITRNCIVDEMNGRKKEIVPDPEAEDEIEDRHALELCLKPFVRELPAIYRDAIEQTELGKLSQKEYAEKINTSYSTVKSRVQRAKQQLHALFLACCQPVSDSYGNIIERNEEKCQCAGTN